MNKFYCKSPHTPPLSYGDCVRACVATLTNDSEVPHVFQGQSSNVSWGLLRSYLKSKGLDIALCVVDDPFEQIGELNPEIPYLLLCGTDYGDHAVICLNGKVWHDPAEPEVEIKGEHSSGFWVIGFVVECQ